MHFLLLNKAWGGFVFLMFFCFSISAQINLHQNFQPKLKQNFELPNISFEDHVLINVHGEAGKVTYFFYNITSSEINCVFINQDFKIDSSKFQTELFEEPFDIILYQDKYLVLEGTKILEFDSLGKFLQSIELPKKFEKIHKVGNRIFVSNSYNYVGQNHSLNISSLNFEDKEIKPLHVKSDWDGKEFSNFFHEWIAMDEKGFWLAEPCGLKISHYDFKGKLINQHKIKGDFVLGNRDSIKALYEKYPVEGLKKAIIELSNYAKGMDYIERIFVNEGQLLVSVKKHGEESSSRWLYNYSIKTGKLELKSIDQLGLELFDELWLENYGDNYENENFPFQVNLARDCVFYNNHVFTALEMSYYPKGKLNAENYMDGMESYFENNSINYSILIYAL